MSTPHERISKGYRAVSLRRSREEKVAATYQPDDRMEQLLHIRDTRPDQFAALPPILKMSLGHYERAKAAHHATEKQA